MAKYKRVFEPWQIKNVKFKNRIVKTPQDMNFADFEDGTITQDYVDFYGALAGGGVGALINGAFSRTTSSTQAGVECALGVAGKSLAWLRSKWLKK